MKQLLSRILCRLLYLANSDPPSCSRREFYALKERLLHKYASFCGHDCQEIRKPCYGDRIYDDMGDYIHASCGPFCRRCGGTGIFDLRWVRLERWTWGTYVFHVPSGDTRKKPDSVQIVGIIHHEDHGRKADEALLWLCLLTGSWRLLWRESAHVYRYGRGCYPLLNLACLAWFAARLYDRVKANRCFCGKTYRHWFSSTGWCVCRRCRKTPQEIPF